MGLVGDKVGWLWGWLVIRLVGYEVSWSVGDKVG